MQFRFIPILPFTLLASVAAFAATSSQEVTELPDVVVTAARLPQQDREVLADTTVITQQEIAQKKGQSLPELLASQSGIQSASNGGAGSDASLFMRGTNTNGTLVLVDGVRYSSATTGAAALQHIPLDQIERIEIVRGPAASLYGPDAIGGVIQIFTKQGSKQTQSSVEIGAGTQNTQRTNARLSGKQGDTQYALGIAHSQTDGINSITDKANSSYYADKDGYKNSSVTLAASHQIDKNHEFGANLLAAKSLNQYDSYKYDSSWAASAQSYDYRSAALNGSGSVWSRNQLAANWISRLRLGYSQDDYTSYTPVSASDLSDKETRFTTRQNQASWQNDILVGPGTAIIGVETLEQRVSGDTAYSQTQRRINSVLAGYNTAISDFNLQANARSDRNSQFGEHTSGQAGASWQITPSVQTGATLGTAFKAPTFNDLYYPDDGYGNKGNASLKPETALNREAFLRYQTKTLKASATYYENRIKNMIAWAPVDPNNSYGAWQPSNIGTAQIKGASFSVEHSYQLAQYGARYDWLDARDASGGSNDGKRLIRRASQTGGLFAGLLKEKAWSVRAELNLVGKRYENAANTKTMGGYALTNLAASWQLEKDWQLIARFNNIFDRNYEQAQGYGTLGRNGLISLRWEPK